MPGAPPTTRTEPADHLWAARRRRGRGASSASTIRIAGVGSPNPMSTTSTRPHRSGPSPRTCPVRRAPKVTVSTAVKARSSTVPSDGSRPVGTSTATTGRSASIQGINAGGIPWRKPPPNTASTTRSSPEGRPRGRTGTWAAPARPAAQRAASVFGMSTRCTSTATPRRRRCRAATYPSPPLFPGPTRTATRSPYPTPRDATCRATPYPARSMSTSTGSAASRSRRVASDGVMTGRIRRWYRPNPSPAPTRADRTS